MNKSILYKFFIFISWLFSNLFSNTNTYEYDSLGNLFRIDDQTFQFACDYDSLNRLKAISCSNGKRVEFSYDLKDRCISMIDSHGETKLPRLFEVLRLPIRNS